MCFLSANCSIPFLDSDIYESVEYNSTLAGASATYICKAGTATNKGNQFTTVTCDPHDRRAAIWSEPEDCITIGLCIIVLAALVSI